MPDEHPETDPRAPLRELRQHLESLARAGLDSLPVDHALDLGRKPGVPSPKAREALVAPPPRPREETPAAPTVAPRPAGLLGAGGLELPVIPPDKRAAELASLAAVVATCRKCPHLADARTQTVFGVGSTSARLMFIGEAPGADEDHQGVPFVGRAGRLLTDMITKGMGLTREEVYIANILKCRPPDNRNPEPDEAANCLPYLERQIAVIRPEFLCLLGLVAVRNLLGPTQSLGLMRSKWHDYRGIKTLATYHPSYLLRNAHMKRPAWEDLQMLMKAMGIEPPRRGSGLSDPGGGEP